MEYEKGKKREFSSGTYRLAWRSDLITQNNEYSFVSNYRKLLPAFIWRTYAQDGRVYSITQGEKTVGLGLYDSDEKIGTLFGQFQQNMVQYGKFKYVFCEMASLSGMKMIETYDVYRIANLQENNFNPNHFIIQALTENYLPAVAGLIANEDYGKITPSVIKWVEYAMKNEIAIIATAKISETWVKEVLEAIKTRKFPPPDVIGENVLMGAGFATFSNETGWLYGLYVHPAFRNLGIGKDLALARLNILKEMGATEVLTEIATWNGPAKKIYQNLGANAVGKMYLLGKNKPKVRVRRH